MKKHITLYAVAIFFLVGAYGGSMIEDKTGSDWGLFVFLLAGGVVLLYFAVKSHRINKRYSKYMQLIINQHKTDIDEIAKLAGQNYTTCSADLHRMVDRKYLVNTQVDDTARKVIVSGPQTLPLRPIRQPMRQGQPVQQLYMPAQQIPVRQPIQQQRPQAAQQQPAQPRVVECKSCGAKSTVTVAVGNCEYCGSPLA